MARPVKCQKCGAFSQKEEMEFEVVGKARPINKYYHKGNCWEERLKEKEFLAKEKEQKDELNEVLKRIYGVKEIPHQAWTLLENLRGGNPVFGKNQQVGKRYKQGYEYPLIKETFEYCSDTIEYWNSVKDFNGFMGAFKYALTIVIDKIYYVEQRAKEREKKKAMVKGHLEAVKNEDREYDSNYKKPEKAKNDITDFLDD